MTDTWRDRAFSTDEAAAMAGVCRATLDVWAHRFPGADFSQKREGRRWFSPSDITGLRVAMALGQSMPLAEAIPTAVQHLAHPPSAEALLVAHRRRTFTASADTAARWAVERGASIVPIGRIASEVGEACAERFAKPVA